MKSATVRAEGTRDVQAKQQAVRRCAGRNARTHARMHARSQSRAPRGTRRQRQRQRRRRRQQSGVARNTPRSCRAAVRLKSNAPAKWRAVPCGMATGRNHSAVYAVYADGHHCAATVKARPPTPASRADRHRCRDLQSPFYAIPAVLRVNRSLFLIRDLSYMCQRIFSKGRRCGAPAARASRP